MKSTSKPIKETPHLPRPYLSEKTARRFAELERVLGTDKGDGIAETLLSNALSDIMEGDHTLVLDGWEWDDKDVQAANLRVLANRWNHEEVQEVLKAEREAKS